MEQTLWLFFPDYRLCDPYQELLARAFSSRVEARPGTVTDALESSAARNVVFHVHWEDALLAGATNEGEARRRVVMFAEELNVLRDCGGRVIWTRHNASPHEDRFPAASAELRRILGRQADLLHVHGATAARLMREDGGTDDRLLVLRNPDIGPGYPNDIDDSTARRYFHLGPEPTVFAFLGAMRSYKGAEVLLRAFAKVRADNLSAELIIGGGRRTVVTGGI